MAVSDTNRWLGALSGDPRDFSVFVFVPSQTQDGVPIDHDAWRSEALTEMARLFGGATAIEGNGAWRDDSRGGTIALEKVSTVLSLMPRSAWNEKTVSRLARFLHRMGRETQQGEV